MALALLSYWMPLTASADTRCATVNIDKVLKSYKKAKEQREALLAKQEEYDQRLATLTSRRTKVSASMADLRKEIDQEAKSENDKEAYRDQAQKLHDQYKSISQAIDKLENINLKQAQEDSRQLRRSSLSKIHTIIQQYARDQQYDWIIDTSGRSNSTISPLIYAKDAAEITDEIMQLVNQ